MDLIIVGAGSVGGHIALNLKEYSAEYNLLGFVDDNPQKQGQTLFGYDVLGTVDYLFNVREVAVVIGIAFPKTKSKILKRLHEARHLTFPTLISKRAWLSAGTSVGEGCIIYPGVCINYGSRIKDFVVINMNCSIGHDCEVDECSSLAPGVNLAGHTKIGKEVDLGIGASSRQGVFVNDYSTVGGQAMIISDVKRNSQVVGIPAKEIKSLVIEA